MCLTIFSPDIWPGEGFSYCLRICSGATRILTEWSPSLYRDDALSSTVPIKGNSHMISPDRTRLISILLSNSRLPGHLSPDLWHSMLIILILLIHATTRQQWNASWQSKRRRSAQILSTAIVTVALATRTGMKRVGTRPDGRRCHVPVWKRWNTASYIFGSRMLI